MTWRARLDAATGKPAARWVGTLKPPEFEWDAKCARCGAWPDKVWPSADVVGTGDYRLVMYHDRTAHTTDAAPVERAYARAAGGLTLQRVADD